MQLQGMKCLHVVETVLGKWRGVCVCVNCHFGHNVCSLFVGVLSFHLCGLYPLAKKESGCPMHACLSRALNKIHWLHICL